MKYLTSEIILSIAFVLNFALFLFFKKLKNSAKTSTLLSCSALFLSTSWLLFASFNNYSASFRGDLITINHQALLLKIVLNIFCFIYLLITYDFCKKLRHRLPYINSIFFLMIILSSALIQNQNFVLSYILLEGIMFLIYRYSSNTRAIKSGIFNSNYIFISFIATLFFVCFYTASYFASQSPLQQSVILACMSVCILLKIGIFPIYNYLIEDTRRKNIPYEILTSCFLPFIGCVAFVKIIALNAVFDEIYQLSIAVFVLICALFFALGAYKTKDITKFAANSMYFFSCIFILNSLFENSISLNLRLISGALFALSAFWSLCVALELNTKSQKLQTDSLEGLFFKNRLFAFLFSFVLLCLTSSVPSILSVNIYKILKEIYIFDKSGYIAICIIIFCSILILLNALKMIEKLYSFDIKNVNTLKLTRQTTLCQVICLVMILFLTGGIIL